MPWESIGSVDTGQLPGDSAWIDFCQDLAVRYIKFVCGEPAEGFSVGIMMHDHDLGSYPSIGVWSEFSPDFEYVHKCERALDALNEATDWESLKEHYDAETEIGDENESGNDDEIDDAD